MATTGSDTARGKRGRARELRRGRYVSGPFFIGNGIDNDPRGERAKCARLCKSTPGWDALIRSGRDDMEFNLLITF